MKWRSVSTPRAHNLLEGLLRIYEEVESVIKADSNVV